MAEQDNFTYYTESGKAIQAVCIPHLEFADNPRSFDGAPWWFIESFDDETIRPFFANSKWGYLVWTHNGNVDLFAGQYLVRNNAEYYQVLSAAVFHRTYFRQSDIATQEPEQEFEPSEHPPGVKAPFA